MYTLYFERERQRERENLFYAPVSQFRGQLNYYSAVYIVNPGKILSPFLVHSTFTVRLQMVNYSGYG